MLIAVGIVAIELPRAALRLAGLEFYYSNPIRGFSGLKLWPLQTGWGTKAHEELTINR
jgi:hypothetical protein